jgi:hypothetical protein
MASARMLRAELPVHKNKTFIFGIVSISIIIVRGLV